MQVAPLATREAWLVIVNALLGALVATGVLPPETEKALVPIVTGVISVSIPLITMLVVKKLRSGTGAIPFVHPGS